MKDASSRDAQDLPELRVRARHDIRASKRLPSRTIADALIEKRVHWKSKPGVSVVESSGTLLDLGRKPGMLIQGGKAPRVIIETPHDPDGAKKDSRKRAGKATVGRYTASVAMASRIPEEFMAMRQSRLARAFT